MTISDKYPDDEQRKRIAKGLFDFTNSSTRSPIKIVSINKDREITEVYKVNKLSTKTYKYISNTGSGENVKTIKTKDRQEVVARISLPTKGRKKAKVEQLYSQNAEVAYSPKEITSSQHSFVLHAPLTCRLYNEGKYYVIEYELMDLYATGETEDEAEQNFGEEFDYKYHRLNELDDTQLSERLVRAKSALNTIVKDVIKLN